MLNRNFHALIVIMSVQKRMCFMSAGFSQKFFVKLNDVRILVRFAESFPFVFGINGSRSCFQNFAVTVVERLSATTNATARTCHNLNGVILGSSCTNFIQQFSGITQSVCNTNIHRQSVKINRCRTNAFDTAKFMKLNFIQRFSCK